MVLFFQVPDNDDDCNFDDLEKLSLSLELFSQFNLRYPSMQCISELEHDTKELHIVWDKNGRCKTIVQVPVILCTHWKTWQVFMGPLNADLVHHHVPDPVLNLIIVVMSKR